MALEVLSANKIFKRALSAWWVSIPILLAVGVALVSALNSGNAPVDWGLYQKALADPARAYELQFFNPPWALWVLLPLCALPYPVGLLRLFTIFIFLGLTQQRGSDLARIALLGTSLPFLHLLANGNIDALPALAFLLADKGLGLALLLIKPQAGFFAVLAWLKGLDWRGALKLAAPTLALLSASLWLYGGWPLALYENILTTRGVGLAQVTWNAAWFPWSLPLGLVFLWRAWRDTDEFYGVTATLLVSPYVSIYSWTLWYALFLPRVRLRYAALVWVFFWSLQFIYFFNGLRWR